MLHRWAKFFLPAMCGCLVCDRLAADTVYLTNGSYIDGIVRARDDTTILIEIGNIGKVEIPIEEVYEIEKNSRTGSEQILPVDNRKLDVKVKHGKKVDEDSDKKPRQKPRRLGESDDDDKKDKKKGDDDGDEEDDDGDDEDDEDDEEFDDEDFDEEPETLDDWGADEEEEIDPELKARIEKLVDDLQRQKSRFRVRAERHLKVVGPPAIPFLLPLAKKDSDLVRVSVFRLFHAYGDDRVIEPCIDALQDSNEYVRDYANRALERITQEDFGFKPMASPRRREHAKKKWSRWWQREKKALMELRKQTKQ